MIAYIEDDDGWSFQMDIETKKVMPGEFRFVTFAGSPVIEYTSGNLCNTRTYWDKMAVVDKFTALGFTETTEKPKHIRPNDEELSSDQIRWLISKLESDEYFELTPGQFVFAPCDDKWPQLIKEMKECQ